jgi:hypothetical protein
MSSVPDDPARKFEIDDQVAVRIHGDRMELVQGVVVNVVPDEKKPLLKVRVLGIKFDLPRSASEVALLRPASGKEHR